MVGQPIDESGHSFELLGAVHGTERRIGNGRRAYDGRPRLLSQRGNEIAVQARRREHPRRGRTVLASVEITRARYRFGRFLDVSVIDELPPGRTPITTRRVPDERSDEVWTFVRKIVSAGQQVYVVYPVIEEGALEGELKAAMRSVSSSGSPVPT